MDNTEAGKLEEQIKGSKLVLNDLLDGTLKFHGGRLPKDFEGSVAINKMTLMPKTKTVIIHAEARGTKLYSMIMRFYGVDFVEQKDSKHPLVATLEDGTYRFISRLDASKNKVQVRCSDPSFRYTFADFNKNLGALVGRSFPAYAKKTNRPAINQGKYPGLCKHLIAFARRLQSEDIVKNFKIGV